MATKQILCIDNVFLPAGNLQESRRFYADTLGLTVKFDFSERGLLAFRVGSDEAAIILKDSHRYPDARPALLLQVADVQQLYTLLAAQGVHFTKKPYRISTGWAAELQDPGGNVIGITDYH
ncbi:VOC family protein [Chitinophaga japonensis]|uniref:Putative enzyme related to lactoylglutathione lyase n=1 Tax=Chitinophaga japonensis TaxID=104662 RepID=A0A562TCR3_CHIJA|nr:VOC family protein [Chitinophaga japonensis]TWI91309.1 putative enzyme related to lactoylglutathione lyase [Chitinophaga japonensis]